MPFKIVALPFGKCPDVKSLLDSHTHALWRLQIGHWGNQEFAGALESDKAAIEQMVAFR
jgi:hypothetical protein